ncbi:unnamed protein product [Lathyrus sativus]|nr:unnamed protein product [Lathyrus sativus]
MSKDNTGSFENIEPPTPIQASSETSQVPTPMVNNVDDYEYLYVTEALSAYPNCYTTEWDDMFESARAPVCEDLSTYFFNPLKPQLPLSVLIPSEPQNTSVGDSLVDSSKLVVDKPHNQILDSAAADSSLKPRKRGRPKKIKTDVVAGSSQKVNQLSLEPKKKRLPKSK